MFSWNVVLTTLLTMFIVLCVVFFGVSLVSAVNVRKRREELKTVHTELKIGSQIVFAGGLYGKVVGIEDETVNVEIGKGTVIKASRYSIQTLMNGDSKKEDSK